MPSTRQKSIRRAIISNPVGSLGDVNRITARQHAGRALVKREFEHSYEVLLGSVLRTLGAVKD